MVLFAIGGYIGNSDVKVQESGRLDREETLLIESFSGFLVGFIGHLLDYGLVDRFSVVMHIDKFLDAPHAFFIISAAFPRSRSAFIQDIFEGNTIPGSIFQKIFKLDSRYGSAVADDRHF